MYWYEYVEFCFELCVFLKGAGTLPTMCHFAIAEISQRLLILFLNDTQFSEVLVYIVEMFCLDSQDTFIFLLYGCVYLSTVVFLTTKNK
jgi:hypothetical protein